MHGAGALVVALVVALNPHAEHLVHGAGAGALLVAAGRLATVEPHGVEQAHFDDWRWNVDSRFLQPHSQAPASTPIVSKRMLERTVFSGSGYR